MYGSNRIFLSFDELKKWYEEINKPMKLSNITKKEPKKLVQKPLKIPMMNLFQ